MTRIGNLLEHYDSDKYIALYGLNGKLPETNIIELKLFALNGDFYDPDI
jgi:hypothetical protein